MSSTHSQQTGSSPHIPTSPAQSIVGSHVIDVWSAPETVLGWAQDLTVDCWSFGLVLWYMLTGNVRVVTMVTIRIESSLTRDSISFQNPVVPESAMASSPVAKVLEAYILHSPLPVMDDSGGIDSERLNASSLVSWVSARMSQTTAKD